MPSESSEGAEAAMSASCWIKSGSWTGNQEGKEAEEDLSPDEGAEEKERRGEERRPRVVVTREIRASTETVCCGQLCNLDCFATSWEMSV